MQYRNHTKGTTITDPDGKLLIDHLATSPDLPLSAIVPPRGTTEDLLNDGSRKIPHQERRHSSRLFF
ncbi:MAG: hypothetical protein H8M99_06340 [Gloeobacteraceae cyanobacterium ES-bin-144]|nr:hypothetical protein [Verrucomicrobiales bacterium]